MGKAKQRAADYLSARTTEIVQSEEIFHMAIASYALSLGPKNSQTLFDELWKRKRKGK